MSKIRLDELERIIDLLNKYPIVEVHRRTGRSFTTLARIAEIHLKEPK